MVTAPTRWGTGMVSLLRDPTDRAGHDRQRCHHPDCRRQQRRGGGENYGDEDSTGKLAAHLGKGGQAENRRTDEGHQTRSLGGHGPETANDDDHRQGDRRQGERRPKTGSIDGRRVGHEPRTFLRQPWSSTGTQPADSSGWASMASSSYAGTTGERPASASVVRCSAVSLFGSSTGN